MLNLTELKDQCHSIGIYPWAIDDIYIKYRPGIYGSNTKEPFTIDNNSKYKEFIATAPWVMYKLIELVCDQREYLKYVEGKIIDYIDNDMNIDEFSELRANIYWNLYKLDKVCDDITKA